MKDTELRSTKEQPGWLLPYLFALDEMFIGRWDYWLKALEFDHIPPEPIPCVRFRSCSTYPGNSVMKNLCRCIEYASCSSSNVVEKFIDWLLWGFNYKGVTFPNVDDRTDDFWYRTFNLGLFLQEPGDYMAELAQNHNVGQGSGFFSTPISIAETMVRMTMGIEPSPYHKAKSVVDPCCGTGSMLLVASNYSLNLYGCDINPLLCKMAIINAFIYMPWVVYRPKGLKMFDKSSYNSIIEVEMPSGIKVPQCQECGNRFDFVKSIETDCIVLSKGSDIEVVQPEIEMDLIRQRLVPENIICAPCFRKIKEEIT